MSRASLCLCIAVLSAFARSAAAQSQPPDDLAANPARPTVSTPATLTPVGYLQFETGVLGATDSPEFSTWYNFNEVIKLAVAPRLQLIASTQPFTYFTDKGVTGSGTGGVALGAQVVVFRGEGVKPTLAVSYFHSVYGGDTPDLDIGSPTNSVILLVSADVKGFHYDANAVFNEELEGAARRLQFGQTLSISHPIAGNFALSGEIWRFTQPFLRGKAVGNLWAVSYAARKNLVFDAGFEKGLTSTSTRWEAFAGFTYLLPHRLW